MKPKLSIIIPTRDETVNLKIMLRILQYALDIPHEILIVVDRKDDEGIPTIKSFHRKNPAIRLVLNTAGIGIANAIRAGVKASHADTILIFAADEVGPVLAIDDMLELVDHGCDLVSCTRYARGGRRLGGSLIGGLLSRIANWIFHTLGGLSLTDGTTGIKMFRKSLFEQLTLEAEPKGWAVMFEFAIKAQLHDAKLGEVPIVSIDRLFGGTSTFQLGPWIQEYTKWFVWGMVQLWKADKRNVRIMT